MKFMISLLMVCLLCIPLQPASAKSQSPHVVVLRAGQVDGANDIEEAIINATAEGTRPGTVILNGVDGPFVYTDADRSLNIFYSNLTLRGINRAVIENCDDGLFFDDVPEAPPIEHILVEDITFFCTGDGVEASGTFYDVTLRDNVIQAGYHGIGMMGDSEGWLITGNLIQAGWDGVWALGAAEMLISGNNLSGNVGVSLQSCSLSDVRGNSIQALDVGVALGQESWGNLVQKNIISGVVTAGIALGWDVTGNRILANRVFCAAGASCLTVDASPETAELNLIAGNKP